LNTNGGCEVAITARIRIGWMKFRECGKLFKGKRFLLTIKRKVYKSCVSSVALRGMYNK